MINAMRISGMLMGTALLASSSTLLAEEGLKPACRGLMSRDGLPPAQYDFIDSIVVNVNWADLEPTDNKFIGPAWGRIETARKLGKKIRLRILCGIHAPAFVKALGGLGISDDEHHIDCSKTGGIALWNPHDNKGGSTCCWWTTPVLDQYEQLMREVARRYEDAPEICEVCDSGAMTLYAEPFYRAHNDLGTNARLFQAGLTLEKDRAAHERCINIHAELFKKTRTNLSVNAWDVIDDSSSHHQLSFERTFDFLTWAGGVLGDRLVLQNNGLGTTSHCPPDGTDKNNTFCFLSHLKSAKGFQTQTLQRLGGSQEGLDQALANAVKMGASFVELPGGYQKLDKDALKAWDAKFEKTP